MFVLNARYKAKASLRMPELHGIPSARDGPGRLPPLLLSVESPNQLPLPLLLPSPPCLPSPGCFPLPPTPGKNLSLADPLHLTAAPSSVRHPTPREPPRHVKHVQMSLPEPQTLVKHDKSSLPEPQTLVKPDRSSLPEPEPWIHSSNPAQTQLR